jgi:hypothetical protein
LKRILITTIIIVVCSLAKASTCNDTLIIGIWKGTSICRVKSFPGHDEIAVYHVSKRDKPGTYQFAMNKMVNGTEEDMGVLPYTYDAAANTLTSADENRKTIWKFKLSGKTMEGTLFYNNV